MKTTKESNDHKMSMDNERVLSDETIRKIANEYEEQERLEEAYRQDLENKIKELNQLILNSQQLRMPYRLLYKPEYGDYRTYVAKVAEELRRRNDCR
jgi:hypothetical protein